MLACALEPLTELRTVLLLFCHHQNALDKKALENLGSHSLEEAKDTFALDDELHDLDKTLEWLSLSFRRRL